MFCRFDRQFDLTFKQGEFDALGHGVGDAVGVGGKSLVQDLDRSANVPPKTPRKKNHVIIRVLEQNNIVPYSWLVSTADKVEILGLDVVLGEFTDDERVDFFQNGFFFRCRASISSTCPFCRARER